MKVEEMWVKQRRGLVKGMRSTSGWFLSVVFFGEREWRSMEI